MAILNCFLSFARRHKHLIRGGIAGGPALIVLLWSLPVFAKSPLNGSYFIDSYYVLVNGDSFYFDNGEEGSITFTLPYSSIDVVNNGDIIGTLTPNTDKTSYSYKNGAGKIDVPTYTFDNNATLVYHFDTDFYIRFQLFPYDKSGGSQQLMDGSDHLLYWSPNILDFDILYKPPTISGIDFAPYSGGFSSDHMFWDREGRFVEYYDLDFVQGISDAVRLHFTYNFTVPASSASLDLGLQIMFKWSAFGSKSNDAFFTLSDGQALNDIESNTDQIMDQQKQYHDLDQQDATQAGSDMAGFSKQLEGLKEGWGILWYPITFTQRLLTVFTGGSNSAVYTVAYDGVTGYSYDEDSGFLVPIRSPVATIADLPSAGVKGAKITFPSYTLPVLNVKLWDSFSFDLSSVKEQFPALFNAIYVVITVLEVFWFVSFLRSKYEEVFG